MSPRKPSSKPDALVTGLDRAAQVLLDQAFPVTSDTTEPPKDGGTGVTPLADQIKAFAAVSKWATERIALVAPSEPVKGKGERIRDRFQRATLGRGNGDAQSEDATDPG